METFLIGFTSFSENKISKTLVCEYMIYCIMRNKEPMFIEVLRPLSHSVSLSLLLSFSHYIRVICSNARQTYIAGFNN